MPSSDIFRDGEVYFAEFAFAVLDFTQLYRSIAHRVAMIIANATTTVAPLLLLLSSGYIACGPLTTWVQQTLPFGSCE